MPYYFFLWTPEIIGHLAEHEVTPQKFEEVVSSPEREGVSCSTGGRRHVTMPISRPAVRRGPLDVATLVGWYNAASGRACPAVEEPNPVKPSMNDISCPPSPKPRRRWLQFSLRTLMVFVLFVSLGLGGLAMIIERARREARLHGTRNAFRWVYICLSEHDERCKHLPYPVRRETVGRKTKIGTPNGNGRHLYSWRGEISAWTQCGYSGSVRDRSEPWDSPSNQVANHVGPGPYCYSSHDEEWKQASCETNMLAICGPGTAFGCEGDPPRSLKSLGSNAILVVEVRHSGIHWMQPGDFDIQDMPRTINASDGRGISSRYPGGFHVLFSDGDVWFLSEKIPFETLAKFFTVDEANQCNRDDLLGEFVLWRFSMSRAT